MSKGSTKGITIRLAFDKSSIAVAGFPFGVKVFQDQVKRDVTPTEPINIVFPDNILKVSSSFWQGFFKQWVELFGLQSIRNHVTVIPEKLNQKLHSDMPYWIEW